MQHKTLVDKTAMFVCKHPFVKAVMLADLEDGVEIFKYLADDLELKKDKDPNFLSGLRHGMTEMFSSILDQMKKLGDATKLQVTAFYNQYYVK